MKYRVTMAAGAFALVTLIGSFTAFCAEQSGKTPEPADRGERATVRQPADYQEELSKLDALAEQGAISETEKAELKERLERLSRIRKGERIIDDLAEQGAIDEGERAELKKRLVRSSRTTGGRISDSDRNVFGSDEASPKPQETQRDEPQAAAGNETAAGAAAGPGERAAGKVPFAYQEIRDVLETLADQGVVDVAEKSELTERLEETARINRGEKATWRIQKPVGAADIEYRRTTLPAEAIRDDLKFLAYQNIMTRYEAADAFKRFGRKYPTDQMAETVSNEVSTKLQDQLKQKMDVVTELQKDIPQWLKRFKLSGDIRMRYENDFFNNNNDFIPNPANPTDPNGLNTKHDRQRFLLRARLGVTTKVNDQVEAHVGLSTGTTANPVSNNVTLGDGFNKKSLVIDTAYLKWTPAKPLTAWGGRLPNPWVSTDLVWDRDLGFDGVAATYAQGITDTLDFFVTAGAFSLQEVELSQRDKWLFGGQIGASYRPTNEIDARLAVAYYFFENTQGRMSTGFVNQYPSSLPPFVQKGNTYFDINSAFQAADGSNVKDALAARFHELNITSSVDLGFWHPIHLALMGDYVINLGYDKNEVNRLTNGSFNEENMGYQFGLALGHPVLTQFADWKAYLYYRYLEADAVMDAYTDSDFHLGGTNAKGWGMGMEFGLGKNFWLTGKWMTASQISGERLDIDVFQLDLNARF